jgi:hypothetical protein
MLLPMRPALVVLVVVVAVAGGIEGVTLLWKDRDKSSSVVPSVIAARVSSIRLARHYAPILRFDSGEHYKPIDRDHYVAASQLWAEYLRRRAPFHHKKVVWRPVKAAVTLEDLPQDHLDCAGAKECHYFLELGGIHVTSVPAMYGKLTATAPLKDAERTVYWHAAEDPDGDFAVQYWLFYAFNEFLDWHDGDWEEITIRLTHDGDPVAAAYSSHHNGLREDWAKVEKRNGHPVVYVARGSHANYFSAGKHAVLECHHFCKDRGDGLGGTLPPAGYRLVELASPVFLNGDYTPGNYIGFRDGRHTHVQISKGTIIVSEPQTRDAWDDPLGWLKRADPVKD